MDIWLPGLSGIEALAQLRTEPATRDIPVIAVTASSRSTLPDPYW
jgi:CheY-like chemotaxis protein